MTQLLYSVNRPYIHRSDNAESVTILLQSLNKIFKKNPRTLTNSLFQKSHSDLKIIIFYENLQKSSNYFKRKFAKKKIRNKNMLTKLVGTSKLGKSVFDLVK